MVPSSVRSSPARQRSSVDFPAPGRPTSPTISPVPTSNETSRSAGSDSTAPSSPLVGSYNAVQFITTGSSGQTNQILAGSTLSIDLAPNGRTTGHLHVAPSGVNPAFDADMAGTWAQNGSAVTFSQTADTFVR